jgi:hypothetical protein
MRRLWGFCRSLCMAAGGAFTIAVAAHAQGTAYTMRAVRFLVEPEDSLQPAIVVDPSHVTVLRQRVSVNFDGVARKVALKELSRLSGLDFVYALDVVSPDAAVHLKAADITVAAALTEILLDADVDVLLKPEGNAVLVKRGEPTSLAAQKTAQVDSRSPALPADTILGRVTRPDSIPLRNVTVRAISSTDSTVRTARTDSTGAYRITFDKDAGNYTVVVTAPGYVPQRRTVTRPPDGANAIVADFRMQPLAQTLNPIRATAVRPRPPRDQNGTGSKPGELSTASDAYLSGVLTGDPTGDLTSLLATVPGLTVTPDPNGGLPSISFAGLGSEQNATLLGGVPMVGQPPPESYFVKVLTATYDPGKGNFAGVYTNLVFPGGGYDVTRFVSGSLEAPELQYTTPVGDQLGQRYTRGIVNGVFSGPVGDVLQEQRTAFSFSRRDRDPSTLLSATPTSLIALGVSPDSVSRLLSAIGSAGIPLRAPGFGAGATSTSASLTTRLDFSPPSATLDPQVSAIPATSFFVNRDQSRASYVVLLGNWSENTSAGSPQSLPLSGADQHTWSGMIQAYTDVFVMGSVLNATKSTFSASAQRTDPNFDLPSASVLLNSALPNGTFGSSVLQAAGNGGAQSDSRSWTWDVRNDTRWMSYSAEHEFAITLEGTVDHYASTQGANLGAFSYNSLADFESGTPASFSRTLSGLSSAGQGLHGAIGLGDTYKPSRAWGFQLGLRLDGTRYDVRPALNPAVDSAFGLRTDHVPSAVTIAPMAGFTWNYRSRAGQPTLVDGSRAVFGGIRDYTWTPMSASLDPYTRQTGLPSALQQIRCVGSATPTPEWSSYAQSAATIPDQCADGTAGSVLAQTTPPVAVFSPDYTFSHRWGAQLGWVTPIPGAERTTLQLVANAALNLSQASPYDVNFSGVQRFALNDEGGRPVFVSPSSIVPATGAVAWSESRAASAFAQVRETRSDLRSTFDGATAVLTIPLYSTVYSSSPGFAAPLTLSYSYADARRQYNGFGATTAGDPRATLWMAAPVTRHTAYLATSYGWPGWGTLTANVGVSSGMIYTPRVNADINGDGLNNDRAFVFNPASTSDATVAAGMRSLLASAPRAARDCLLGQMGAVAGADSCEGPWSESLNLRLSLDAYRLGFKNRGAVVLAINNALGAADQLLHGADHLRGWGQPGFADPTLLNVRGFDPATNRFLYSVNPFFGGTSVQRSAFRPPFSVVLSVRLDLGPDRERTLINTVFAPGSRNPRFAGRPADTTEAQIKARLLGASAQQQGRLFGIIQKKDTLKLTRAQVDTLAAMNRRYMAMRDSIYGVLAKYLASRHGDYDDDEVGTRWHAAITQLMLAEWAMGPALRALLTPEQFANMWPTGIYQPTQWPSTVRYDSAALERLLRGPLGPH